MNGFVKRQPLKSGGGSEYKRYRCGAKFTEYHNGACLSESVIEDYLLTHVEEAADAKITELSKKQRELMQKPDMSAAIRAELDRLNIMYQKGRIKEAYYDEQYARLSEKLEDCSPLEEVTASLEAYRAISRNFTGEWQQMYRNLDIGHKKSYWKEIIRQIEVDAGTRRVCGFTFRI